MRLLAPVRAAMFRLAPPSPSAGVLPASVFLVPFLALLLALPAGATPDRVVREAERFDHVPATPDGRVPVVIESESGADLVARIEELGGTVTWVFENMGGISALVPPDAIAELLADSRVGVVHHQRLVRRAVEPIALPDIPGRAKPRLPESEFVPAANGPDVRARTIDPREWISSDAKRDGAPVSFLGYDHITGAAESWEVTNYGEGVTVAIIDTGVYPTHVLYDGNVVGGMNLVPAEEEMAIDLDGDGAGDGRHFDWDAVENHYHGTFVAGLVAGHASLEMPEDDPFLLSVAYHSPESVEFDGEGSGFLHLMGTAPGASLYGVKVFPYDGGSSPDARIAEAIDRLITMRRTGELDVDVINMSLGGPVLFDGWNPLDLMVAKATLYGITVVSSASNDGPALVTVGSPGSALTGLTAGATSDPIHTRVAIETFFGAEPGFGTMIYPHEALLVTDFSSRGLTADGRVKPDLVATGLFVFSSSLLDVTGDGVNDYPAFGFGSGTSFSAPTISGAAALVTAFADLQGAYARAPFVENVLKKAAEPIADRRSVSQREQGRGFVHVPGALRLMERGQVWGGGHGNPSHPAMARRNLASGAVSGESTVLSPGETYNFLVKIPRGVSQATFRVSDVQLIGPQNPLFGDNVLVVAHSAKRGGADDYVYGDTFTGPGEDFVWHYPEPGTARITMAAPFSNYGDVTAAFEMTAQFEEMEFDGGDTFEGFLRRDQAAEYVLQVPEDLDALAIRLAWKHDWSRFPTYDLDLLVMTPDGPFPVATIDSPELAWIEDPPAGEWRFLVADIGTVLRREKYRLEIGFVETRITKEATQVDLARPRIVAATPNPFEQRTEMAFTIPRDERVRLVVYDVAGRAVRTLVDGPLAAGPHRIAWDGSSEAGVRAAAGVYFLRLDTAVGTSNRKVVKLQ